MKSIRLFIEKTGINAMSKKTKQAMRDKTNIVIANVPQTCSYIRT